MRARLLLALLAAFALLAAPAPAQEPTPSPTPTATPEPSPTPEPAPERSDDVKAVFRDYRRDSELDGCEHDRRDLRAALKSLTDEEDLEFPDLRYLLEAAIDEHKSGDCEEQAAEEEEDDDTAGGGTVTPTPTVTPTTPTTPVTPTTPDSSFTPSTDSGDSGGRTDDPLGAGDLSPVTPEVTPVPPANAPESTTIPPAEAATPAPAPAPVFANADDPVPVSLIVLAALLGLVALVVLAFALLNRSSWGEKALARPRMAWREAAFRAGGTWGDFADWIRVGR